MKFFFGYFNLSSKLRHIEFTSIHFQNYIQTSFSICNQSIKEKIIISKLTQSKKNHWNYFIEKEKTTTTQRQTESLFKKQKWKTKSLQIVAKNESNRFGFCFVQILIDLSRLVRMSIKSINRASCESLEKIGSKIHIYKHIWTKNKLVYPNHTPIQIKYQSQIHRTIEPKRKKK